jgi:hypothetical protein
MTLGPDCFVSEGHTIIAQPFSVGFYGRRAMRPEGTPENSRAFGRPFGTLGQSTILPNAEALGYCHTSLRDVLQILVAPAAPLRCEVSPLRLRAE